VSVFSEFIWRNVGVRASIRRRHPLPASTLGASYMARVEFFPKATEERVERTPIAMIYVRG
jgi:hypothetical protein